jgi:hypothetical protein
LKSSENPKKRLVKSLSRRCAQGRVVVHFFFDPRLHFSLLRLQRAATVGRRVVVGAVHRVSVGHCLAAGAVSSIAASEHVPIVAVQGVVGSGLCFRCFEANGFVDADTLVTVSIAHHVARAATIGCAAKTVWLKFSRGAAWSHEAARRERNVVVYRVVARDVEAAQFFFDAENAIFKRNMRGSFARKLTPSRKKSRNSSSGQLAL